MSDQPKPKRVVFFNKETKDHINSDGSLAFVTFINNVPMDLGTNEELEIKPLPTRPAPVEKPLPNIATLPGAAIDRFAERWGEALRKQGHPPMRDKLNPDNYKAKPIFGGHWPYCSTLVGGTMSSCDCLRGVGKPYTGQDQ